jgi:ATP-binding cassette subfamily B protein
MTAHLEGGSMQAVKPGTLRRSEFTVTGAKTYDHRGALRWIISHILDYKLLAFGATAFSILSNATYAFGPVLIGRAAQEIVTPTAPDGLLKIALSILLVLMISGITDLAQSLTIETLAQHLENDARAELYINLLGKSQTFHDRQRVGDIMARATEDTRQLNAMINPGVFFIFNTVIGIAIPMIYIAQISLVLLIIPSIFVVLYIIALRRYMAELNPVARRQREQFGKMNAGLEETISGIEVVKASAQEPFERRKFNQNARLFRDYFVRQGNIEARYLPVLLLGATIGFSFLHAGALYLRGTITAAQIIGFMGLLGLFRFPTFISIFSFSLVQFGIAGAERILSIITAKTELDENKGGFSKVVEGAITFEKVWFSYDSNKNVLENVSFSVAPGQTVAIVGQTGSGKSTLTQLINRTYDTTRGRVLIDGVDVREWDLTSLRSQISKIEQDVFLFSRSIADNIAFSDSSATQAQIEQAAREAQAHDFIMSFKEGYQTVIGERGVTLSGGQRQRLALARAFLSNPRILVLDDSTSAIDSATEDEIQKAIRKAQEGRTTLLITHRLSQIRWADVILLLEDGKLIAQGSHDDLLRRSAHYRRIFARYEVELPPLESQTG